jgi:8-hydroxy-5-deazaflavin:NADPH oxidoreductase
LTTVGILGAGKLGTTLAQLTTAAGYRTLIAGSGQPEPLELILSVLAPEALARRAQEIARDADIVILALPIGRHRELPEPELRGKTVIDAMNYWPDTDGILPEFENRSSSSQIVATTLPAARIVKALSHLGYHELLSDARPVGAADRHAIAIAGDDPDSVAQVSDLVDSLGFDPVSVGALDQGIHFGPSTASFGVSVTADELVKRIDDHRASLLTGGLHA